MLYYSGNQDISTLASIPDEYWQEENIKSVSYNSKDLGTVEAKESMRDLFDIVNEKVYGIDDVLNDIINSDPHSNKSVHLCNVVLDYPP